MLDLYLGFSKEKKEYNFNSLIFTIIIFSIPNIKSYHLYRILTDPRIYNFLALQSSHRKWLNLPTCGQSWKTTWHTVAENDVLYILLLKSIQTWRKKVRFDN